MPTPEDPLFIEPSQGLEKMTGEKPKKTSVLFGTPAKKIGWIILSILLFMLIMYARISWRQYQNQYPKDKEITVTKQEQPALQPSSGKLEIVQYEWRGQIVQDRGRHTSASILTDDVFWQWRFDGDDSRIYDFYPAGYKPGSNRTFPDQVKLVEWRIKPGQKIQKATIVWSILDN